MAGERNSISIPQNPNKTNSATLRVNPFTTYRDPVTGQWLVIKTPASSSERLGEWVTSQVPDARA